VILILSAVSNPRAPFHQIQINWDRQRTFRRYKYWGGNAAAIPEFAAAAAGDAIRSLTIFR
jgi:hypothetical protein